MKKNKIFEKKRNYFFFSAFLDSVASLSRVTAANNSTRTHSNMARGLSRDLSRAKNAKKAKDPKGNKESSLTPSQRAERDKKAMEEKKRLKEQRKQDDLKSGKITREQIKEEELRKAKLREKQRETKFATNNPLLAKNLQQKK